MTTVLLGRICRTCLTKSSEMHKLREFIEDDLQIYDMLDQAIPNFDLELEDAPLPVEICKKCLGKLRISYEFQQKCMESNQQLRVILAQDENEVDNMVVTELHYLNNTEEFLKESDILMDNCKIEAEEEFLSDGEPDYLHGSTTELSGVLSPVNQKDPVKHEFDLGDEKEDDISKDESSSEEYWPNDEKEESDGNFFENNKKDSTNIKPKRKYRRKVPLKPASSKICSQCNKSFSKRHLLTRHMSVHSMENTYVCNICQFRFPSERQLKTHITSKHMGIEISLAGGPYPCPDCPMIFQQTRALAAHRVMHLERDFKCQVCGINCKTMAAVTRHMNSKHPDVLPYKCQLCDKAFPVETHLNDHINEHLGQKKYKCEMCEKSFPNTTALKDHLRTHTGESPYLCSHCGMSFKTSNVLRQHLQRHGEKNFQCPECPMKFYAKVNLTKHLTSHSKVKRHVCDVCGSAFTRQDTLKAHKFKHTGERPFKCADCNLCFVFKRHLKRHRITHTGEKPHMCTYCDRAYAASGDLVKHLRTHIGEKTYFCDECPESFKYCNDLRDHKNQHYKEKLVLEHIKDDVEQHQCDDDVLQEPNVEDVVREHNIVLEDDYC